jgi:transcriptional regulator with XRE-family HTH domain
LWSRFDVPLDSSFADHHTKQIVTSQDLSHRMMETSPALRLRFQAVAAEFVERLGARMRKRREELDLSMAEVARRMPGKVSENQVYRWELGKHQPKPDTLEALAKVLKTDVAALMAPAPDKSVTPEPFGDASRTEGERLDSIQDQLGTIGQELAALLEVVGPKPSAGQSVQEAIASVRKDLDKLLAQRSKLDLDDARELFKRLAEEQAARGTGKPTSQSRRAKGRQGQRG